ncbi:nascent polypeptide-associated complex subunit alpha, muscle-specific form-like [Trichoplusia ni]|uniref:Nascent polypeptide-associated complex subunit alpha, muscle-specific form-like n=1 Tax=Trichoplusia ni TaxID=7111 RepID=A0A7E5WVK5_TRINI|nr:nascent polypeptide-associated complex subunit alpha, muscle-specific form-like [Trichoplusia ni]
MSEEMAVSDNTTGDEAKVSNDEAAAATVAEPEEVTPEDPSEPAAPEAEETPALAEAAPEPDPEPEPELEAEQQPEAEAEPEPTTEVPEVKEEPEFDDGDRDTPLDTQDDVDIKQEDELSDQIDTYEHGIGDEKRGIKRRASDAFSDGPEDEFIGFDEVKHDVKTEDYCRILERLEAEVTAASKDLVPLRTVMGMPAAPGKASKRPRTDTDGSRPSSALSSRSDGEGATDPALQIKIEEKKPKASSASSPAQRGRRATTEMSSPLLRVPLERGWKRELVYRAALDAHSRRNADIYYYTPYGKKLRSTREIAEHLAGTGLTVENFSFFKEPLGVDDPEKEIIRDAKLIRRVDSPVAATAPAAAEGKRTPKPKQPKGASPEPAPTNNKSPPAKLKVKSMGSRLSNSAPPAAAPAPAKPQKKPATPATTNNADNNNSAAWKKPSAINPPLRVLSGGECSAVSARPSQPLASRPPASAPPPAPPPAPTPAPSTAAPAQAVASPAPAPPAQIDVQYKK